jgi:Cellulose binding domain
VAAKFSGGRSRISRHGRHRGSRASTVLLDSPGDLKPIGGFAPHYFRRLGLQIGAAYVVLALGAFGAVGFGLRSAKPVSAPPVHIPPVVFPTASPFPAQTVGASPGTTARASAAPSVTSPIAASPATVSPVAAPSDTNPAQPAVSVSYLVVAQYDGQFEGEVAVENKGSAPISGWQIVVALPGDLITSFSNASGYVSNHVLLLQPAYDADAIAANGTLSVYFTAVGPRTTPEVCAFNDIICG